MDSTVAHFLAALVTDLRDSVQRASLAELCAPDSPLATVSPMALRPLFAQRAVLHAALEEELHGEGDRPLIALVSDWLLEQLQRKNQFLETDAPFSQLFRQWVGETITRIASALSEGLDEAGTSERVRAACTNFAHFVATFLRTQLGETPRDVVCSDYSAELQLRVLALTALKLDEPVVDIGCGESAKLVRTLRAAGVSAHGVDRHVPQDLGVRTDWMQYTFLPNTYGTILSHQAFSLHFLHHHLRPGHRALDYACKYRELIHALRPGGIFVYAPGLPFIEGALPKEQFEVTNIPIDLSMNRDASTWLMRMSSATGLAVAYCAHVRRR